jgi:hypothetical protein
MRNIIFIIIIIILIIIMMMNDDHMILYVITQNAAGDGPGAIAAMLSATTLNAAHAKVPPFTIHISQLKPRNLHSTAQAYEHLGGMLPPLSSCSYSEPFLSLLSSGLYIHSNDLTAAARALERSAFLQVLPQPAHFAPPLSLSKRARLEHLLLALPLFDDCHA